MNLCEVIKEYRLVTKRSAQEVGTAIGISPSTLLRIEGGETPSGSTLAKVLCWLLQEGQAMQDAPVAGEEHEV